VEQADEMNSLGRARQGSSKIKDRPSFKGVNPGSITLKLGFKAEGYLRVNLLNAKLGGKKSQDPYALVYLLDKNGKTFFQVGNHKTETFKKNIEPQFNQEFNFNMRTSEISSKSLVIAIWDKDSTSRDDYMAGIRLSLQDVEYFTKWNYVTLELMHQEMDGHPAPYADEVSCIRKLFGYETRSKESLDLRACNNHLVSFIERARVLAEAYDFKNNMPTSLTNTVSSAPLDVRQMFRDEIARMKHQISLKRSERTRIEEEGHNLRRKHEELWRIRNQHIQTLGDKRKAYYKLCCEHAEISVQFGSIDAIKQQTGMIWDKMSFDRNQLPGFPFRETVNTAIPSFSAGGGGSNVQSLEEQYRISVITAYEKSMRARIEEMRVKYKGEYKAWIANLDKDAQEIIRLYQDILREKFNPQKRDGLRAILEGRNYQGRIDILLRDIEDIKRRISGLEGKDNESWYRGQLADLRAKINALMDEIRALLKRFTDFTSSRFDGIEISLFKQLLEYEEKRISSIPIKVPVEIRKTSSRMHKASTAGMSMSVGGGRSYSRHSVADSGIASPVGQNTNTIEGGGMMSSSRYSSGSSMGTRTSMTLENLRSHMDDQMI